MCSKSKPKGVGFTERPTDPGAVAGTTSVVDVVVMDRKGLEDLEGPDGDDCRDRGFLLAGDVGVVLPREPGGTIK